MRPAIPKKRRLIAILLTAIPFALFAAWAPYGAFRYGVYRNPLLVDIPKVQFVSPEFLLFMCRGRERLHESEKDVPFRNTRICLYKLHDGVYQRVDDMVLMGRSTVTSHDVPRDTDIETVHNATRLSPTKNYPYGHESVPAGIYNLRPSTWKNGDPCFSISSYGAPDGIVVLGEPQTLKYCRVFYDDDDKPVSIESTGTGSLRSYKQSCFIHPSLTRIWSHADSNGCINFQRPAADIGGSDYEKFLNLVSAYTGTLKPESFGLLLIDEKDFTGFDLKSFMPAYIQFTVKASTIEWNSLKMGFEE